MTQIEAPATRQIRIHRDTFTATVTFTECQGAFVASIVPYCLTHLRSVLERQFTEAIERDGFTWEAL